MTLAAMFGKHPELLGGKVLSGEKGRKAEDPTTERLLHKASCPSPGGGVPFGDAVGAQTAPRKALSPALGRDP